MLVSAIIAAVAWATECPSVVSPAEVNAHVEDALLAFATLDEDGFRTATTAARQRLPCVRVVFPPGDSAAFHRMVGLDRFLAGRTESARLAFEAALAIEPGYSLSGKIATEGGSLYQVYESARQASPAPTERIESPHAYVDGTEKSERSTVIPAIVQLTQNGEVTWTAYRWPGEEIPVEKTPATDKAPSEPIKATEERKMPRLLPGVATGVVALGLYGVSAASRLQFDETPSEARMRMTNGTYLAAVGTGAVSAGLITVAFVRSF